MTCGETDAVIHAAVRDVDIRAADATVGDVEAHLPGAWRNQWSVPYEKLPAPS